MNEPTAAHAVADQLTEGFTQVFVLVDESAGEKYYPAVFWTLDAARADLRTKVKDFFDGMPGGEKSFKDWKRENNPDVFDYSMGDECYRIYNDVHIQ